MSAEPLPRPAHLPPPVCRRGGAPGCGEPALEAGDFCAGCGLRYLVWRAARDMLERADLAGTPYPSYEAVADDSPLGRTLDVVHRVLTVEPFA